MIYRPNIWGGGQGRQLLLPYSQTPQFRSSCLRFTYHFTPLLTLLLFFYSRFPLPWPLIPFSFTNGSRPINSLSRHLYTGFIAPPCPSLIFLANSRTETLSSAIYPRFMSYCLLLPPTNLLLLLTPTCIFFTPAFIFRFPFPSLPVPSSLTTGLSVPAPLYTDYRPPVQPLICFKKMERTISSKNWPPPFFKRSINPHFRW